MKRVTQLKFLLVIFILIGSWFAFSGCIDEQNDLNSQRCSNECILIQGRLTTAGGVEAIPNVDLKIQWVNVAMEGGGVIRAKAKSRTNTNGAFSVQFAQREDERREGYYELIYYVNEKIFHVGNGDRSFALWDVVPDSVFYYDFQIARLAYAVVTITNRQDIKGDDYMNINLSTTMGLDGMNTFTTGGDQSFFTSDKRWTVGGDQPVELIITRKKDGVVSEERKTINVPSGQTKTFEVTF
ncbi:hypothetical protein [Pseudochryseolinea flava]|uniref:Uncharacterized protein n=1 Tax=Pseudochryseolinea flava TaxID=2059302 RepID=A0A364XZD9_9BACT|nr:hypothetical protein [Pseudochryseolinea flava]RAV99891.1 hypothetical protein DQQ10_17785 [Pseudochryseolinea flava]